MARTKTKPAPQETLLPGANAIQAVQNDKAIALAQADPIFAIIERLSKDPAFDVDKMERLINMHERAKAGNARAEFDQAMSLAQQEMMAIRTNAKSDKGKYANYAALDKAIRPIYTKHGFSVSFDTDPGAPELTVRLVATVAHSGGHRERRQLDVPADGKGAKGGDVMTKTHATASAITYGKRYLSSMIWNLAVDNDDDGNAASSAAERFKVWTDTSIQELNAIENDKATLDKWFAENEKSIGRLRKNAPEQFERYQTAYSNAAERCGIKNEEPKRGKKETSSAGASPHSDQPEGKPEGKAASKTAPSGQAQTAPPEGDKPADDGKKQAVTDVADLNDQPAEDPEPMEFETFTTIRPFLDWSSKWLEEPARTVDEAKAWEEHYRADIKKCSEHTYKWITEGIAGVIASYSGVLSKATQA